MKNKTYHLVVSYDQIPIETLKSIIHNSVLTNGAVFFAIEFIHNVDEFVENYFDYLYSSDDSFNIEECLPYVHFNQELFMIELYIFHNLIKNYINQLIGSSFNKLNIVNDIGKKDFLLELEL